MELLKELQIKLKEVEKKEPILNFQPITKEEVLDVLKDYPKEEAYPLENNLVLHNFVTIYNYYLLQGYPFMDIQNKLYLVSLYGKTIMNEELKTIEDNLCKDFMRGSTMRKRLIYFVHNIYAPMYHSKSELKDRNYTIGEWFLNKKVYLKKFKSGKLVGNKQAMLLQQDIELIEKVYEYFLNTIIDRYYPSLKKDNITKEKEDMKEEKIDNLLKTSPLIELQERFPEDSHYISYNFFLENLMYFYTHYQQSGLSKEEILPLISMANLCGIVREDQQEKGNPKISYPRIRNKELLFYKRLRQRISSFYTVRSHKGFFLMEPLPEFTLAEIQSQEKQILMNLKNRECLTDAQVSLLSIDFELIFKLIDVLEENRIEKIYTKKS